MTHSCKPHLGWAMEALYKEEVREGLAMSRVHSNCDLTSTWILN